MPAVNYQYEKRKKELDKKKKKAEKERAKEIKKNSNKPKETPPPPVAPEKQNSFVANNFLQTHNLQEVVFYEPPCQIRLTSKNVQKVSGRIAECDK